VRINPRLRNRRSRRRTNFRRHRSTNNCCRNLNRTNLKYFAVASGETLHYNYRKLFR
jgi:hypothetical protein